MRSLLMVRAERAAAIVEAARSGADALVLDIAGSKLRQAAARAFLAERDRRRSPRIFALVSKAEGAVAADLDGVMPGAPDGIVWAGAGDGGAVALLGARIAAREAMAGLTDGQTALIPLLSTAPAFLAAHTFRDATSRLAGLAWDGAALAAELKAETTPGDPASPIRTARDLCLLAAAAAGVPAIDGPSSLAGAEFREECVLARKAGFRAKLAADATQVDVINQVFGTAGGEWPP